MMMVRERHQPNPVYECMYARVQNSQLGDLRDEVEGVGVRLEGDVVPGGDGAAVLLLARACAGVCIRQHMGE